MWTIRPTKTTQTTRKPPQTDGGFGLSPKVSGNLGFGTYNIAVIAEPIGSLARRLHTALGNLAHAVLTSEPAAAAAEVEADEAIRRLAQSFADECDDCRGYSGDWVDHRDDAEILLAADRAAAEARGASSERARHYVREQQLLDDNGDAYWRGHKDGESQHTGGGS